MNTITAHCRQNRKKTKNVCNKAKHSKRGTSATFTRNTTWSASEVRRTSSFILKSKSNRSLLPRQEGKCLFPFPCSSPIILSPDLAFWRTGAASILARTVKLRALFMTGHQNEEDENTPVGVLLSPNTSLVYPQPSQSCNTERPVLSLTDYSNALELWGIWQQ